MCVGLVLRPYHQHTKKMQNFQHKVLKSLLLIGLVIGSIQAYAQENLSLNNAAPMAVDSAEVEITKEVLQQVLRVYPNPAKGPVTVRSAAPIQSVQLLNTNGRQLHTYAGFGLEEVRVNYSEFRPGMYLLQIEHENGQIIHRRLHIR